MEIGLVFLCEAFATCFWVCSVILKDASRGKVCHVNAFHLANVCQGQHSNHIGSQCLDSVCLTPINVGPSCQACCIQDVGGLVLLNLSQDARPILEANLGETELFSLG